MEKYYFGDRVSNEMIVDGKKTLDLFDGRFWIRVGYGGNGNDLGRVSEARSRFRGYDSPKLFIYYIVSIKHTVEFGYLSGRKGGLRYCKSCVST